MKSLEILRYLRTPHVTGTLSRELREFPPFSTEFGWLLRTSWMKFVESENALRGNDLVGQQ